MKFFQVAVILLLSVLPAVSQCGDPTFSLSDKVETVKAKLSCFANQLARVQAENASLKAENEDLKSKSAIALSWKGLARTGNSSVEQCKSKAADVFLDHHGTMTDHGVSWVAFNMGDRKAVVECDASSPAYLIFSDHVGGKELSDLTTLIGNEIFP